MIRGEISGGVPISFGEGRTALLYAPAGAPMPETELGELDGWQSVGYIERFDTTPESWTLDTISTYRQYSSSCVTTFKPTPGLMELLFGPDWNRRRPRRSPRSLRRRRARLRRKRTKRKAHR